MSEHSIHHDTSERLYASNWISTPEQEKDEKLAISLNRSGIAARVDPDWFVILNRPQAIPAKESCVVQAESDNKQDVVLPGSRKSRSWLGKFALNR